MSRLTFDDYAYHAWTTAYYLDAEPAEQYRIVHGGFNEEVGELLNDADHPVELSAKLWGMPVAEAASNKLDQDKLSEGGDILYFISAAGLLRNAPLRDIAAEAIERYTGTSADLWDESIDDFDALLAGRMDPQVPTDYRPNYRIWKDWDFAPFVDGLHIVLRDPAYAKGPLTLIPDGRYALERLHSTLGRFMLPESSTDEEFRAAAGLALGGLSIVLQSRFNGSLAAAAHHSIVKRERRQLAGTLQDGTDADRSRPAGEARAVITDEQGTTTNLLQAPLPEAD